MNDRSSTSLNASKEVLAQTSGGDLMLLVLLGVPLIAIVVAVSQLRAAPAIFTLAGIAFFLVAKGFYVLQPNQAAAILLFGSYKGPDRATGLRWVWTWMGKSKVSARADNMISETIKVNDLRIRLRVLCRLRGAAFLGQKS